MLLHTFDYNLSESIFFVSDFGSLRSFAFLRDNSQLIGCWFMSIFAYILKVFMGFDFLILNSILFRNISTLFAKSKKGTQYLVL